MNLTLCRFFGITRLRAWAFRKLFKLGTIILLKVQGVSLITGPTICRITGHTTPLEIVWLAKRAKIVMCHDRDAWYLYPVKK